MKKNTIKVSFSELKGTRQKVIETICAFTGEENIDCQTKIENDLGYYGMDNEEISYLLHDKFKVDFSNFEYDKYLTSEGELANPVKLLFLPILLIRYCLTCLTNLYSKELSCKISELKLPFESRPLKKDVTIGDLVLSVVEGKFTERKNSFIEIV